jgi:hypothetical protein
MAIGMSQKAINPDAVLYFVVLSGTQMQPLIIRFG